MYTHLVKFSKFHKALGLVVHSEFRTTADAVVLHTAALGKRVRTGELLAFSVVAL